jgi:hypothetical protein
VTSAENEEDWNTKRLISKVEEVTWEHEEVSSKAEEVSSKSRRGKLEMR